MNRFRNLIAGCGDVGTATGVSLVEEGHHVVGLRRTINQLPEGIHALSADLNDKSTLSNLPDTDILIYCTAANGRSEEAYQQAYVEGFANILAALPNPPKYTFFTSSTSVYGQQNHEWVNENSPLEPSTLSGKIMVAAEQQVLTHPNSTVVRFSGIYGPGRMHLLNSVRAGIIAPSDPVHYSNRIHRDDCAGVLVHLVKMLTQEKTLSPIYLASDEQPTPIHNVTTWLAEQHQIKPTQEQVIGRGGSKRCDSTRLKASGYRFLYPSYQEGFANVMASMA